MDRHLSNGAAAWPVAPFGAVSLECDADACRVLAQARWSAVADIQKRQINKGVRWDVRYRDDANRQRKRSFARKADAQHFAN